MKFAKFIALLLSTLVSVSLFSQCEVFIEAGSVEVIDHEPGVQFQFQITNQGSSEYTGGTLRMNWTLGSFDPIWQFDLQTPLQVGETMTISTPKLDIPAVWPGDLNIFTAPDNQPTSENPWLESVDWFFYTYDFPYPGPNGNGGWAPIRLALDGGCTLADAVYVQVNGENYYGPLIDGCINEVPDQFCDRSCGLDIYELEPDYFSVTVLGEECFNYNQFPRASGVGSFVTSFSVGNPQVCSGNINYNNFDTLLVGDSVQFDYYEYAIAGNYDCLDQVISGVEDSCRAVLGISNPNILVPPIIENDFIISDGDPLCLTINDVDGCTDPLAQNYNELATIDDGSCEYRVDLGIDTLLYTLGGCDTSSIWWQPEVVMDNLGDMTITELCVKLQILGQQDDTLCLSGLNIEPGESFSVFFPPTFNEGVVSVHLLDVNGQNPISEFGVDDLVSNNMGVYIFNMTCSDCTDPEAWNYNEWADQEQTPSNCLYGGCVDPDAINYDPSADVDDGSCEYEGCTDPLALNYDPIATFDDGSCQYAGCTDPLAVNYDPDAEIDDGSCQYAGCTDPLAVNYDPDAEIDDGSCQYAGCTDPSALNYNPEATIDDGSCQYAGCMDPSALNYSPEATIDDGSCEYVGCTDPSALNYNPAATIDDGSCEYATTEPGLCDDPPVFAPNAFTPNNDGNNDAWQIVTPAECWREWKVQVFNRWGELIWEADHPDQVWNGSVNGGNYYAADGVYVYVAVGHYQNKADVYKFTGSITLFR